MARKKDDSSVDARTRRQIRETADLLLRKAGAYGRFPTPVPDLVAAAELQLEMDISLNSGFLQRLYAELSESVKRALDKVLGVLDRQGRFIYLDQSVHEKKRVFLSLHEIAHDFLPWQRDLWAFLEESEHTIDPDMREQFEREANVFAGDVLFQVDAFRDEAADLPLGMGSVLKLSQRYGSSFYAAARRYAATHHKPCALVVFDQPHPPSAKRLTVRRTIHSQAFYQRFGKGYWADSYGPESVFTINRPEPEKAFFRPIPIRLRNLREETEEMRLEAFDSGFQIHYLIFPPRAD